MTGGRLMPADWCEVMQLPASGCWHCRGKLSAVPRHEARASLTGAGVLTAEAVSGWAWAELWELAEQGMGNQAGPLMQAQYSGRCGACAGRWEPGDHIAFSEDEDSWLHADCAR